MIQLPTPCSSIFTVKVYSVWHGVQFGSVHSPRLYANICVLVSFNAIIVAVAVVVAVCVWLVADLLISTRNRLLFAEWARQTVAKWKRRRWWILRDQMVCLFWYYCCYFVVVVVFFCLNRFLFCVWFELKLNSGINCRFEICVSFYVCVIISTVHKIVLNISS